MKVDKLLDNIKSIDCPVDKLNERIVDACKVPGIGGNPSVAVDRLENMDSERAKAYNIHINDSAAPDIVAMVREGEDGYVSTVIDAYPSM